MIPHVGDNCTLIAATRAIVAALPDVLVVRWDRVPRWIEAAEPHGLAELLLGACSPGSGFVAARAQASRRDPGRRPQADWVAEFETSAEVAEVLLSEGVEGLRIGLQHHGRAPTGWTTCSRRPARRSRASSSVAGPLHRTRRRSASRCTRWPTARSTPSFHVRGRRGLASREARFSSSGSGARFADGGTVAAAGAGEAKGLEHRGSSRCSPSAGGGSARSCARWWGTTSTSSPWH